MFAFVDANIVIRVVAARGIAACAKHRVILGANRAAMDDIGVVDVADTARGSSSDARHC